MLCYHVAVTLQLVKLCNTWPTMRTFAVRAWLDSASHLDTRFCVWRVCWIIFWQSSTMNKESGGGGNGLINILDSDAHWWWSRSTGHYIFDSQQLRHCYRTTSRYHLCHLYSIFMHAFQPTLLIHQKLKLCSLVFPSNSIKYLTHHVTFNLHS